MQSFKIHSKDKPNHNVEADLYEFRSLKNLGKSFVRKIKATWTQLKSAIARAFSSKLRKAPLFKEVLISIPGQVKEDIMNANVITEDTGTINAIKGNYNEALVMQNIFNHKGKGVDISKKYSQKIQ